ncbi:MAG: RelA/SpoT domain-containing protein [Oscillospiraceae bacterium]|nr:RelA/SpoT domain-containing protein [Oscillospiraceae bacterium]
MKNGQTGRMTNGEIDRAGAVLKSSDPATDEYEHALSLVNEWRSLHKAPLNTFQIALRKKAVKIDVGYVFAQRLKKMKSIKEKLVRYSKMKLSTMQDIGGCRVVLSDVEKVYELRNVYCSSGIKHKLIGEDDYIASPRNSGYRSFHLVFRYSSKNPAWDGLKVEVQLRTRLQHIWATAVETASLLSETSLKASVGEEDWLRFFALASSCFALQEKCAPVPNTPNTMDEIRRELKLLDERNDFLTKFEALNAFGKYADSKDAFNKDYYLLYINKSERLYRAIGYTKKQYEQAYSRYVTWEKTENSVDSVVLVATNSFDSLKSAYPNYFADMREFITAIRNILN